jgi:predicted GIY-YIG superfamily endonuclease
MTGKTEPQPPTVEAPCKPWYLYLLDCADGTTYTGITTDPQRRLKEHNAGRGARYTAQSQRRPVHLLGVWRFSDQASATRAEVRFKRRRPKRKRQLAATGTPFEGAPFCPEFSSGA